MREFKKLPLELFIGYDIEQNSRVIELDASEMVEKYPSGILQLVCKRPGEETTYIAPSFEQDGGTLRWTLTSYDVEKAGQGLAIVALVDTSEESVKVLASHKIMTGIEEGLHFRDAETVDPEDSLIARVLAAVSQAQAYAQDAKEEADRAEAADDAVEDAKDQAISAIETKGAETLDSIPSDYSALSGDVSDLKSAVTQKTRNLADVSPEVLNLHKTNNRTGTMFLTDDLPSGNYVISVYLSNAVPSEANNYLSLNVYNDSTNVKSIVNFPIVDGRAIANPQNIPGSFNRLYFYIASTADANTACTIDRVQIESGVYLTEYIPPFSGVDQSAQDIIDSIVTPELFGAIGDGVTDDTNAIQNCLNYSFENNKTVIFRSGATYAVTSILIGNSYASIDFNGAVLKGTSATTILRIIPMNYSTTRANGYIKNLVVDMNNIATRGIELTKTWRKTFSDIAFTNPPANSICLYLYGAGVCAGNLFEAIKMKGNTAQGTRGIVITAGDNTFDNIDYSNIAKGIECHNFSTISNYHGFVSEPSLYPNSVFLEIYSPALLSNFYPDTQQYVFDVRGNDSAVVISNCPLVFNVDLDIDITTYPPYVFKCDGASTTKHYYITGLSVNCAVYTDSTFTTAPLGTACFDIDGFTVSSNNSLIELHKFGIESHASNANATFESALRGRPMLYSNRYVDKITVNSDIAANVDLAVWWKSSRFAPRNGTYSALCISSTNTTRNVILNVKTYASDQYVLSCAEQLNSGDVVFVDIPVTDRPTLYYE